MCSRNLEWSYFDLLKRTINILGLNQLLNFDLKYGFIVPNLKFEKRDYDLLIQMIFSIGVVNWQGGLCWAHWSLLEMEKRDYLDQIKIIQWQRLVWADTDARCLFPLIWAHWSPCELGIDIKKRDYMEQKYMLWLADRSELVKFVPNKNLYRV